MGRVFRKVMRYQFMLIFLLTGVSFLSLSKNWQIYEEPVREIRTELADLFGLEFVRPTEKIPDNAEWSDPDEDGGGITDPEGDDFPGGPGDGEVSDIQGGDENGGEGGTMPPEGTEDAETEDQGSEAEEEKTFQTVDETYFQDALFIGDSRTVALRDYGKFEEGPVFYASKGLTIFDLFTAEIVEQEGQRKKITVDEALGEKQFRKIYLMLGINELGTGDAERFAKTYGEAVAHIRELQPDAVIYIQSILKVTEERSQRGDYITNQGIIERNEAIKEFADGKTIFYLDVNEAVCDESGCLNPEYSGDGVHVTAKYIYLWKDYLMSHAIEM